MEEVEGKIGMEKENTQQCGGLSDAKLSRESREQ